MRFSPFIVLLHDKWNFQTFYSNEIGKFPWCCGLVASGKDILAVEFSRWTSIKTIKFWISCTSKICHFFWTYWLLRTFSLLLDVWRWLAICILEASAVINPVDKFVVYSGSWTGGRGKEFVRGLTWNVNHLLNVADFERIIGVGHFGP